MGKTSRAALDSNCYTYLVGTLSSGQAPAPDDPLGPEKLALVRTMLYDEWGLYITPTVTQEYLRIRDPAKAALHESWTTLFAGVQPIDPAKIEARAQELLAFHSDSGDCHILAEAEDVDLRTLITYDGYFISRLGSKTTISIIRPTEYWARLNIQKGARPKTIPHPTNPLVSASWWRWE